MEVRLLKKGEEADYCRVSAASFIWSFDEKNVDEFTTPVYGAFDNGKLIAGLETPEFTANFCGTLLPALGIGGVASMPEQRRRGGVRAIFNELERIAPKKGWVFGALYPFSVEYYSKFGYTYFERKTVASIPFTNLSGFERNCNATLFEGESYEELYELHNKYVMQYNLATLRNEERFFCGKPLEKCNYFYVWHYPDGTAGGYADFTIDRTVSCLIVKDFICLDVEAMRGLIGFLRNYDGVVKNLKIGNIPLLSPLLDLLSQVDGVTYEYGGAPAGRIYDLPAILAANSYPDSHGSFVLECKDSIKANNGVFAVEYQNGKAQIKKSGRAKPDIILEPCAAAKLILSGRGYNCATASAVKGVTLCGDAEGFFRAFPSRPTAFIEGF